MVAFFRWAYRPFFALREGSGGRRLWREKTLEGEDSGGRRLWREKTLEKMEASVVEAHHCPPFSWHPIMSEARVHSRNDLSLLVKSPPCSQVREQDSQYSTDRVTTVQALGNERMHYETPCCVLDTTPALA